MESVSLTATGRALFSYLSRQFIGNHLVPEELAVAQEYFDEYPIKPVVYWKFERVLKIQTVNGNGAIDGRHFGYSKVDFDQKLRMLSIDAVRNREIRGPFLQRMTQVGVDSLHLATMPQPVHDFGSYSVHRECNSCSGRGRVRCGGCGGLRTILCTGCAGAGRRNEPVTRTHYRNGQHHTTTTYESRTCSGCGGVGRVSCLSCGGRGDVRCGTCAGHGYFTDIASIESKAIPSWHIPDVTGLHADELVHALRRAGPASAREFVDLSVAGTIYDSEDNWCVLYHGTAAVSDLRLTIKNSQYTFAGAGPKGLPITFPAVFDYLLGEEIDDLEQLAGTPNEIRKKMRKHGYRLFENWKRVPALDGALQRVARLDAASRKAPDVEVNEALAGFVSTSAARLIGNGMLFVLDHVSPAYSMGAWLAVASVPCLVGFIAAASHLTPSNPAVHEPYASTFVGTLMATLTMMLVLSPVAWALSSSVSAMRRSRLPEVYRQRGRNWVPLGRALAASALGCMLALGYGGAYALHLAPSMSEALTPPARYAFRHTQPFSIERSVVVSLTGVSDSVVWPDQAQKSLGDGDVNVTLLQAFLTFHGFLGHSQAGFIDEPTKNAIRAFEMQERLSSSLTVQQLLQYIRAHRWQRKTVGGRAVWLSSRR